MPIYKFNPWWQTLEIDEDVKPGVERPVLRELQKELSNRKIVVLSGLRRTGKSTLMQQMIQFLVRKKGVLAKRIIYMAFSQENNELENIIDRYLKEVLRGTEQEKQKIYIFLDEIQYVPQWQKVLSVYFAKHKNFKFFISGSMVLHVGEHTPKNIKNKFKEIEVKPLDFEEYLNLKGIQIDAKQEKKYEQEMKTYFRNYLLHGGFIETQKLDAGMRRQYIKENILERIIYKDIPQNFRVSKPGVLNRLVRLIAYEPGVFGNFKHIAKKLSCDQRTIARYVSYLEKSGLVRNLYNFGLSPLQKEKSLKKLYLTNTAFNLAISPEIDFEKLLTQFYVNLFEANFFSLSAQKQLIKVVLQNEDKIIPLEIDLSEQVSSLLVKKLFLFMQKHQLTKGYVITLNKKNVLKKADMKIELIPYWRYGTVLKKIK